MNREVPVGYSAREIALERILAQAMRFPDLDIAPFDPRALTQIDARDAALARAIGKLKRWGGGRPWESGRGGRPGRQSDLRTRKAQGGLR